MKTGTQVTMRGARSMTAEFVTNGHPDKVCDQMSDAILDAAIDQDPLSHVAVNVTGGHGLVAVIGEMTTLAHVDIGDIVRTTYRHIGHDHPIGVFTNVVQQAPDIDVGTRHALEEREGGSRDRYDVQGAGDQGIMVGYAVNDGPDLMPRAWSMARALAVRLRDVREQGILPYLRPDGKSQVTLVDGHVTHVTLAAHHAADVDLHEIRADLITHVVRPVFPDTNGVRIVVNGTGAFTQGGFDADTGLTGRKIVVDNYGPNVEIGGGCFSGKDPSKVDRSAAYFCRMVAKSIVAGGHALEAIVKVGYAIGVATPTYISVQTSLPANEAGKFERHVREKFDFRPLAMIEQIGLLKRDGWRYRDTAEAGHFGNPKFPWEQVAEI